MPTDLRRIQRALLSVSDKAGLIPFAEALVAQGVELLSTGGTHAALAAAGLPVKDVSEHTGFPEIMDGRVKTLHPKVHGGLLGIRLNPEHQAAMFAHAIEPIDLLVVNLYPFEATVAKGASHADCIENIDIGGPAMIRAAAKNHGDVAVIVESADYATLLADLAANGGQVTFTLRRKLAQKAYARTAAYDAAISNWLAAELGETAPAFRAVGGTLAEAMRYGENPHQSAAFYHGPERRFGVATMRQLQGKQLSYNNVNDTDAAFECVAEFDPARTAAVVIVKHANPCGVAEGDAGGGVREGARLRPRLRLRRHRGAEPPARRGLSQADHADLHRGHHRPRRRRGGDRPRGPEEEPAPARHRRPARPAGEGAHRPLRRGRPAGAGPRRGGGRRHGPQGRDEAPADRAGARRPPLRLPRGEACEIERHRLREGRRDRRRRRRPDEPGRFLPHRRLEGARGRKSGGLSESLARGAVVASDAFFPFADGLLAAAEAGATAVIQPGGSMRDAEVIAAADEAGLAMVFTGVRHFRH